MDENHNRKGEEAIDERGRNPTQRRIDAEGTDDAPIDVGWEEAPPEREGAATSAEGTR
jgi:hypothetical protein